ncbi:MAG: hypothetical protein WA771_07335 [Chthoniobacterales bacterium]
MAAMIPVITAALAIHTAQSQPRNPVRAANKAVLFEDGFEATDGHVANRPLRLRTGWRESASGISRVTPDEAASGRRSLAISSEDKDAVVSRTFPLSPDGITFIDLQVRPVADASDAPFAQLDVNGSTVGFIRSTERGLAVSVPSTGTEVSTGMTFSIDETGGSNDWIRLTIRQNADLSDWDLFVNALPVAFGLPFAASSKNELLTGSAKVFAEPSATTYLDDLFVTATIPLFRDEDQDGLPDAFETAEDSFRNHFPPRAASALSRGDEILARFQRSSTLGTSNHSDGARTTY